MIRVIGLLLVLSVDARAAMIPVEDTTTVADVFRMCDSLLNGRHDFYPDVCQLYFKAVNVLPRRPDACIPAGATPEMKAYAFVRKYLLLPRDERLRVDGDRDWQVFAANALADMWPCR